MKTKTKTRSRKYKAVLKLPPLSSEDAAALRNNISVNGVIVPIVVDEHKQIIDGSYRKKFAKEFGYECPEVVETGLSKAEKRTLARALNLSRRQFTTEQKRILIADQLSETPDRSNRWIGKQLGVDHKTVGVVRRLLESTGEFPQFDRTLGEDGKYRPTANRHQWYSTPAAATLALLEHDNFDGLTWEPCCGDGIMSEVLLKHGLDVYSSDLVDRGYGETLDFLESEIECENIITNPPFRQAEEFILHALDVAKSKVAMLMPLNFLAGQSRYHSLWETTPLSAVYIFSSRISLYQGDVENEGGGKIDFAWFVWDHNSKHMPVIEHISPKTIEEPKQNGKYRPTSPPPKPSTRTAAEKRKRIEASTLIFGDCREKMRELRSNSINAIICDPIYPEVRKRSKDYPRISETDWHELMRDVVQESRRVLKPNGSAVFILQPNYSKLGQMRTWLWEFVVWAAKEWNLVQDVHWWAIDAMPLAGTRREQGLMRQSVKFCVWLGAPDCYRNQDAVLWTPAQATIANNSSERYRNDDRLRSSPSGRTLRHHRMVKAIDDRGGATPFNLLPISTGGQQEGRQGHPAATPYNVAEWWCRYILPKNGVLLDPMCGSGTTLVAGLDTGARQVIGIDRVRSYLTTARKWIKA